MGLLLAGYPLLVKHRYEKDGGKSRFACSPPFIRMVDEATHPSSLLGLSVGEQDLLGLH